MICKIYSRKHNPKFIIYNIKQLCTTRTLHESHYDVLKVPRNCTSKDIKDAFIQLSKQHHPDRTAGNSSHKEFVKIAEAYSVLSKPESRKEYDLGLAYPRSTVRNIHRAYDDRYNENASAGSWNDPLFWSNRDKGQDKYYESRSYYGIKGVKRVPNKVIVVLCLIFAAVGVTLQVLAIRCVHVVGRQSLTLKRDHMIKKSIEAEEILSETKKDAIKYGNLLQIKRLQERMEQNNMYYVKDQEK